jgi:purine-cytosine permease-like protein
MKKNYLKLLDINQSFLNLSSIQLTGFISLPVLMSSILLIQKSNFLSAIFTLFLANIILWVIRYIIIKMSFDKRKSSIDLSIEYFGRIGTYFIAVLLLLSTVSWFVLQTSIASNALDVLIKVEQNTGVNKFMQIGVLIGILSTLFCMNGIKVIKWVSMISFPILIIAFIGMIIGSNHSLPSNNGFSISSLPIILTTSLGITIDLPTFFRHSKSQKDSYKALTVVQVVSFIIGVGGIYLGSILLPWFGINENNYFITNNFLLKNSLIIFIFISAICANISNVYSSSVGWEIIAPIFAGIKEYLILGLGITIIYILIVNVFSLELLANLTDYASVNLSFVLVLGYLWKIITKSKICNLEKIIYFYTWALATIINILQIFNLILQNTSALLVGFLIVFFSLIILLPLSLMKVKK